MSDKVIKSDEDWKKELTEEEKLFDDFGDVLRTANIDRSLKSFSSSMFNDALLLDSTEATWKNA